MSGTEARSSDHGRKQRYRERQRFCSRARCEGRPRGARIGSPRGSGGPPSRMRVVKPPMHAPRGRRRRIRLVNWQCERYRKLMLLVEQRRSRSPPTAAAVERSATEMIDMNIKLAVPLACQLHEGRIRRSRRLTSCVHGAYTTRIRDAGRQSSRRSDPRAPRRPAHRAPRAQRCRLTDTAAAP